MSPLFLSDLFLGLFCLSMIASLYSLITSKTVWSKTLSGAKMNSLPILLLFAGLLFRTGFSNLTPKLIVILLFYWLTNPLADQLVTYATRKEWQQETLKDTPNRRHAP